MITGYINNHKNVTETYEKIWLRDLNLKRLRNAIMKHTSLLHLIGIKI